MNGHIAPKQHREGRPGEDSEVHRHRTALNVQAVECDLLRKQARDIVLDAACGIEDLALLRERELAQPGDAWLDREDLRVVLAPELDEAGVFRSRPDDASRGARKSRSSVFASWAMPLR